MGKLNKQVSRMKRLSATLYLTYNYAKNAFWLHGIQDMWVDIIDDRILSYLCAVPIMVSMGFRPANRCISQDGSSAQS